MELDAITDLLERVRAGDRAAQDALLPRVYAELQRLAHRQLVGEDATINTTALVHEAWLNLAHGEARDFKNRAHFFGYAATAMRHILVDNARRKKAVKRGGGEVGVDLESEEIPVAHAAAELLALDDALGRLQAMDERLARVVELRFFGGLSIEDTAAALGISDRSVVSDWGKARAFLHQILR